MDILGLGVLIVGESGIGKSECALDLIVRGHRLVADDTVEVRRRAGDDPHRHLPGADAPSHGAARPRRHQRQGAVRHRVDAVVEARRARRAARALGSDARVRAARPRRRVLRDPRPARAADPMPVAPGRNIAILVEVAARNQLLRARGHHAARELAERLERVAARAGAARRPTKKTRRSRREGRDEEGPAGRRPSARRKPGPGCGQRLAAQERRGQPFIVLTGLSGSGKSQAIRALEDLGYFCVDNLPTTLIPTLAKLSLRAGGDIEKVAIVVDVREGELPVVVPEDLPAAAEDAAAESGADLPRGEPRRAGAAVQRDAAAASAGAGSVGQRGHPRRARAAERRSATMADEIVDTSDMTVHELRQFFMGLSRDRVARAARHHAAQLRLQARRAGRRRPGVRRPLPAESALRAGAAAADRPRPGGRRVHGARRRRRASSWIGSRTTCGSSMPYYVAEGKSYLTIAIGCTGGRHRSVMIAERLRQGARPTSAARGCASGTGTSRMHEPSQRRAGWALACRCPSCLTIGQL